MNTIEQFHQTLQQDPSFGRTLINLIMVIVMAEILAWHFVRYSSVLTNKRKFATNLIFIAATTLLLISVVRTSLALSLGLVGALSIVRFRTPIKEPEELAYLFLAIASGIGLGADQRIVTVLVFLVLLAYLTLRRGIRPATPSLRTLLQVSVAVGDGKDGGALTSGGRELQVLRAAVEPHVQQLDLRRVDTHEQTFHASMFLEIRDAQALERVLAGVREALPWASVSIVERDSVE